MIPTIAFDVYGTLIDTHGIVTKLRQLLPVERQNRASEFATTWREKQLEYTFRRGLMQCYQPFSVCTIEALNYTCALYQVSFNQDQKETLMLSYGQLPAFDDVKHALVELRDQGFPLYAFSNGQAHAVKALLDYAQILAYFIDVISVDTLATFKPNPQVYDYFLQKAQVRASASWLVSANSFDIIGASSMGMQTAWVQRSPQAIFDPWGVKPTATISHLTQLRDCLPC